MDDREVAIQVELAAGLEGDEGGENRRISKLKYLL